MRILRHGQACVEVIEGATRIVIDPGALGTPVDLTGATAVLVTHDHVDHADHDLLARVRQRDPDQRTLGPAPLAAALDPPIETVAEGDELAIGPVPVRVVGRLQEPGSLHEGEVANVGYVLGGRVLHPGDAYQDVPDIEVALLPMQGPWVRRTEQERWLESHRPRRMVGIHAVLLNDEGRAFARKSPEEMARAVGAESTWLDEGEELDLG